MLRTRLLSAVALAIFVTSCSSDGSQPGGSSCVGAKCDDLGGTGGDFDYIIVGSGAGGGPLASRLARAGAKVLLLEAGADAGDKHNYQIQLRHPQATEDEDLAWWYFVDHYTDDQRAARDSKITPEGILYPRGGTLGGSTAVNAMITVLPKRSDWDRIAEITGDPAWSADSMTPYYDRVLEWLDVQQPDAALARRDFRLLGILIAGVKEFVDTREGGGDFNPLDLFRDTKQLFNLLNRNINDGLRVGDTEGVYTFPLATSGRRRNGTRERILSTAAEGFPLTVKTQALVTRVLFAEESDQDGKPRAIGVEFLDGARLYRADMVGTDDDPPSPTQVFARREVILSAGAFNSPQLLKLSGIGPREELDQHGIPVRVDLPGVGTNLQDRYEVGVVFDVERDFDLVDNCTFLETDDDPCLVEWIRGGGPYGSNGSVASILMRSSPDRPEADLHIFGIPGTFKGYKPGYAEEGLADRHHFTWVILKGHTDNRGGTVKLRSADPRDRPDINFHYFDDGDVDQGQDVNDLTAMVDAIEFVRRVGQNTDDLPLFGAFREVWPGPGAASREQLGQWVKDEAWGHHASCSNPIGGDGDPMAVLDSRFRVRGVSGLRVVDASVFPRIPGTFIVLPIYMVSERAADVLLEDAGMLIQ
ncbi:MAG TPA: GMC family oxidoreductase [Kofleriaceae bacterium]|nr:GMC family oxidoreductase [Kofleriaceae bacterium]